MELSSMNLEQKRNELSRLYNKAELNLEYRIQVAWGNDSEVTRYRIRTLIANYDLLFRTGRIKQLDYENVQGGIAYYSNQFDTYLKMFPEYGVEQTQENKGPIL